MQQQIWDAIESVQRQGVPVTALDWRETQRDPATEATRLAALTGLTPDASQLAAAIRFERGPAA